MKPDASKLMKKGMAALLCLALACAASVACAQTYRLGDEADEIADVQTALKKLKLYSAEITGHYGAKTEAAVKAFQKKHGLDADGIAGEETLLVLFDAAGMAGATSGGTVSTSSGSASSGSTLRYDMTSDAVLKLQQDLNKLGYYSATISGHFGSKTEAAVMSFQRANGLSADGIAGAKTLALLAEKVGGSSSSFSSSSSSSGSAAVTSDSSSTLLKHGMKNSEAVRTMQQNLKTLGYYSGSVTGNFGDLTKDAVYAFQRANGLEADGIAGSKTLAKIASAMGGKTSASSGTSSSGSASSGSTSSNLLSTNVTLQLNSKSDEVLKLQKLLAQLGFYTGNQTGKFGSITQDAVKAYQQSKGLTADGIAGKKTLAAINGDVTNKTVSSSSGSSGGKNLSAMASSVIYENFYNWRRNYENGEYCTVYDFSTGYSWRLRIMTKDAHMDAEPATAEDTATMLKAFGGKTTWTPKPVWVTFSDGKTYIGSTHDVPHEAQHITDNNFKGHLCVHFPISMSAAKKIGDYATSHQEAITEGWEKTKALR